MPRVTVTGREERVGLEKEGYTHGAIYVLHVENVDDWTQAIIQPKPKASGGGKKKKKKVVNPFSGAAIRAEFKGYGRWRVRTHRILGDLLMP